MQTIKTNNLTYKELIKLEPIFHIFVWFIVLIYPYVKYAGKEGGYSESFTHELTALFFKITFSYFLYLWYLPSKNRIKKIPIVLIFLILNIVAYEYCDNFFHSSKGNFFIYFFADLLTYIGFGITFFAIYTVKNIYNKQLEIEILSKEKEKAELDALKSQVNPHFLFNTLNTIYSNALKKEDKTPDLILKLSDSFRYLLHEGQNELVSIQQEINHIQDYIHLQKERLSKKVQVDFIKDIDDEQIQIAPLLMIGFIENAFKYSSILKGSNHPIQIRIELKKSKLSFYCSNTFKDLQSYNLDPNWKESGIGINSTRKRLQLLYPNNYRLTINKEKNLFTITLNINL